MKVIVNGVEIDIIGGSRLVYDVEADSLSVDPLDRPRKTSSSTAPQKPRGPYIKKSDKGKGIDGMPLPVNKKTKEKLTQDELRAKILEIVNNSENHDVAQQFMTTSCLGVGASDKSKDYLKMLLEQMVEEKILVNDSSSGRSRYSLYVE